jgi:hypothetical protein
MFDPHLAETQKKTTGSTHVFNQPQNDSSLVPIPTETPQKDNCSQPKPILTLIPPSISSNLSLPPIQFLTSAK